MRVAAGPYGHTSSDGQFLRLDQRLSREQVDLLAGLLQRNGRCPNCVALVDMNEGGITIDTPGGLPSNWRSQYCEHA